MKTTILKVAVHREGDHPVYGVGVTYIELIDEAAGYFFEISQHTDEEGSSGIQRLHLDQTELQPIVDACNILFQQEAVKDKN